MKSKKRERLTPEQLDENYKKFVKGIDLDSKGKENFDKFVKKASTPKLRSSK